MSVALKSSQFRGKLCAGKSISLIFTFVVEGTPVQEAYPPRTVLRPPTIFFCIFIRICRSRKPLHLCPGFRRDDDCVFEDFIAHSADAGRRYRGRWIGSLTARA